MIMHQWNEKSDFSWHNEFKCICPQTVFAKGFFFFLTNEFLY